jgi:TolA-binding protein
MKYVGVAVLLLLLTGFAIPASAVDKSPRISDREIIEALADLRAGQKVLQQQIEELKGQISDVKGQISDLRQSTQQQINGVRGEIAELKQSTQQQISDLRQDMNQRFQDMGQRFNDVMALLQILIGVLALVLGGMLAWLIAVWRRVVQVEERQKAFELQGDEIKFLREGYGRLQEMVLQILERSSVPR